MLETLKTNLKSIRSNLNNTIEVEFIDIDIFNIHTDSIFIVGSIVNGYVVMDIYENAHMDLLLIQVKVNTTKQYKSILEILIQTYLGMY